MVTKRVLLFIGVLVSMSSCVIFTYKVAPKEIKNGFTYCFDNNETNIDSFLDINGYYTIHDYIYTSINYQTGFFQSSENYIFYKNGIVVRGRAFEMDYGKGNNMLEPQYFYPASYWGIYKVVMDTIKMQIVQRPRDFMAGGWDSSEIWLKVISKDKFVKIKEFGFNQPVPKGLYENEHYYRRVDTSFFTPLEPVPPFDKSWILKEKWFWCDEIKWREFMDKNK